MAHILFHLVFHLALLLLEVHPLIEQGTHFPLKGWWFKLLS